MFFEPSCWAGGGLLRAAERARGFFWCVCVCLFLFLGGCFGFSLCELTLAPPVLTGHQRFGGVGTGSPTRVGFVFRRRSATVGDGQRSGVLGRLADESGFTPRRYRVQGGGVARFADSPQFPLSLSPCSHDIKKKKTTHSFMFCLILVTSECDSMVWLSMGGNLHPPLEILPVAPTELGSDLHPTPRFSGRCGNALRTTYSHRRVIVVIYQTIETNITLLTVSLR